ncbi:MAG: hypothetical protein J6R35_01330, partial [Clostridia bacterium]|nr:hypothetical protein [Clostridia bacterium]
NYVLGTYEFAIVKKKLTNLEINVTEAVYDVPGVDGSETATITLLEKDGIIPGETVEITVTNYAELDIWSGTFELCIKDLADLAQGQEIITLVASGDYANYELVADANGVVGLLNIVKYSSFGTARVFECQADETDSFTLSAGDKLYLKVMGGENSKLDDFEIWAPTGSAATFTFAVYGLDDTTTPKYVEETAQDYYFWDVCDTYDFYVELTCVTAGGIDVSAA